MLRIRWRNNFLYLVRVHKISILSTKQPFAVFMFWVCGLQGNREYWTYLYILQVINNFDDI